MIKKNFKYLIEGSPIDYFFSTLSKEELLNHYLEEMEEYQFDINREFQINLLEDNYHFIENEIFKISGEKPFVIRYFSIPKYESVDMEICAIAKISNNGTTYTLTNNQDFAELLKNKNGFSIKEF